MMVGVCQSRELIQNQKLTINQAKIPGKHIWSPTVDIIFSYICIFVNVYVFYISTTTYMFQVTVC